MMTQPPFRSRNTLFNEPSFITNTPNFNDSCSNSDNNHKPMHYSSTNVSIATQCVSRIFSRNQSNPAGHVLSGSATPISTKVVQFTHNTKNSFTNAYYNSLNALYDDQLDSFKGSVRCSHTVDPLGTPGYGSRKESKQG